MGDTIGQCEVKVDNDGGMLEMQLTRVKSQGLTCAKRAVGFKRSIARQTFASASAVGSASASSAVFALSLSSASCLAFSATSNAACEDEPRDERAISGRRDWY